MRTKSVFGAFLLLFIAVMSSCSKDGDNLKNPDVVWEYESFMIEAYNKEGGNPYLVDGEDTSNYPLGKLITRDEMLGEDGLQFTFGSDGHVYTLSYNQEGDISLDDFGTYKKEGNFLTGSACYSLFYPASQESPRGFDLMEITNEILEWTDSKLCVKQTQIDGKGTRIINTNNFIRVVK